MSARVLREEPSARRKILVAIDDVTEAKREGKALEAAKSEAERANMGKSRFLAAASHDLRHPLQTITLLQGMLEKRVHDEATLKLVHRLDETVSTMAGMLDKLLDINQLEAGIVSPAITDFPVKRLLDELRTELTYHAATDGLDWRVVPSSLTVRSDPRLLEQIIRNLLSNAVKYTNEGQDPAWLPTARRQAPHRGQGHRPRYSRIGAPGDLRRIPSARQSRARTKQGPRPGSRYCAAPCRLARPQHRCPLSSGRGLGLHHRGAAGASRGRGRPGARNRTRRRRARRPAVQSWSSRTIRRYASCCSCFLMTRVIAL